MLTARRVLVHGRHSDLLPPTTLTALESEPHLVLATTAEERTALALTLSGRMRPDGGTVMWGHDDGIGKLRSHVGLVDSPGVNEPERHQRMRDVIAEDLSLLPRPIRRRAAVRGWAVDHGHADLLDQWPDQLSATRRLRLLADLALADDRVSALVLDGPDRLTFDSAAWLDVVTDFAARGLVVIAVVTDVPDGWTGPVTVIGAATEEPDEGRRPDDTEPSDDALDTALPVPGFPDEHEPDEGEPADPEPVEPATAPLTTHDLTHEPTAETAKDDR
ncbi:ABC transporter ATP-binding protein [Tersicoccus sp. MR15.9]|uniref:ABC transporter ATP-binding protein n=1 Tax=Tersicoccus mangrovi TaxID=3121635 RepID=UPI002FE5C17D